MLIVRSPLRISLFGGGTDIDPFLSEYGSEVLSFTIRKYVYLTIHPLIESQKIMLKYSRNEIVDYPSDIQHPVFREALSLYGLRSIDISVSSDIAAGTGLGSSSSFTVGLLHLIRAYRNLSIEKVSLAQEACKIEIDLLGEPIGVQDQYACSVGGLNKYVFTGRHSVEISPIFVTQRIHNILTRNSVLVRVPGTRSASQLLTVQRNTLNIEYLKKLRDYVSEGLEAIQDSPNRLGEVMHESWNIKKLLSPHISNSSLDNLYEGLTKIGFFGGKLLGAGSSGYLFMVGPEDLVLKFKSSNPTSTLDIKLDSEGSKVIYNSEP